MAKNESESGESRGNGNNEVDNDGTKQTRHVSTASASASPKVTSVSAAALLGESPFWIPHMNALVYVDILGFEVRRLRHSDKQGENIVKLDESASFIVPVEGKEDQFVIGQKQHIALLTWDGHSQKPPTEVLINVGKGRKNYVTFGKVDPAGRLWTATSDHLDPETRTDSKSGALFSLSSGRNLRKHKDGVSGCYGLEWSLDGKTMFFVEPMTNTIDAFDFDSGNGDISNRRVIFDYKDNAKGEPRGLTIDEEGKLWVASFGGSQILRLEPATGAVLKTLPVPSRDITNMAFGGEDLYVTTSASRLQPSERNAYPGSGTTFRVTDLGVRGGPQRHCVL